MAAPTAARAAPRTAPRTGAEILRRRERRRRIGVWVATGVMAAIIVTVGILAVGFNASWWTQAHPVASTDQKAPDGSSTFTQAGIDYFTRVGTLDVSMGSTRPTAGQLGLADRGTKHLDFLVPLTVTATATSSLHFDLVDSLDVLSSNGRLSAIELRPQAGYEQLRAQVHALAPDVGWSDSAVAAFDAALIASRQANGGDRFTATIGPAASTGMRVSATLSGASDTSPTLVIRLDAAR